MLYPKSNHSMLYINNNEREIIFIVGGRDLKTLYYDIKPMGPDDAKLKLFIMILKIIYFSIGEK